MLPTGALLAAATLCLAAVLPASLDSSTRLAPEPPAKAPAGPAPVPAEAPTGSGQLPGETIDLAIPIPGTPFNDTGNTCGYANDYDEECPYFGSFSPDLVYSFSASSDRMVVIDLCESGYDTKVYVYENAWPNVVACNDDACGPDGYRSEIWTLDVLAGNTYYIVIDGYGGDCGDYVLQMFEIIHEVVECPDGAVVEGEPDCADGTVDSYNSGCSAQPVPLFTPLFGTPDGEPYWVCGTGGTFVTDGVQYRDTDWYEFVLTEPKTVSFEASAEFPFRIFLIDGNAGCDDLTILADDEAGSVPDVAEITYACAPGTYWFWIGSTEFDGVPCGADYVFRVEGLTVQPTAVPPTSWARLKGQYR